jgi:hypothetical protein
MAIAMSSTSVGVSLNSQTRPAVSTKVSKAVVCKADATSTRRSLLSLGALTAAFIAAPMSAKAGLTPIAAPTAAPMSAKVGVIEDLLAKSEANKAKNDKERLASSSNNFARNGLDISIKKV